MNNMNVLYDYQAFGSQRAGGVSRYFVELMKAWQNDDGVQADLVAPLSVNRHLREARQQGLRSAIGVNVRECWGPSRVLSLANRVCFGMGTCVRSWEIYHPTYYNALWPSPRSKKRVVTVFDMTHERFPSLFSPNDPTTTRKRLMVASADGIICISESTRRDLIELMGTPEAKIKVIHLATWIGSVRATSLSFARPYWLFVGARGGYKDFGVLLDAMAQSEMLKSTSVICYGGGPFTRDEQGELARRGLEGRFHAMSGTDSLLRSVYENAIALVYPSRYEGFGLPPLEAMTLGCPAIVADGSSLPEVVGGGGEIFPSGNADALSTIMERILVDESHRRSLKEAGFVQASRFSWSDTAARTRLFYDQMLA